MAQHDYVIANGTGAAVRSDLNNALAAIVSQNSGATAPSTTYAYQWWADTTTGLLKLRNAANNAWITLFQLDGEWSTLAVENGTAAAPSIYFKDSGTDTGIYSPGADQVSVATGGTERLRIDSTGQIEAVSLGTAAAPIYTWVGDPNTGIYSPGADQVAISTGGTVRLSLSTTAVSSALAIDHPLGAVGTPSITFTGDLNTGIYSPAADTLAFVEGGVEAMRIDSSGRLLVGTSASFDLNASVQSVGTGAYRFEGFRFGSDNGIMVLGSANGTQASPSVLTSPNLGLGIIQFRSYDGAAYRDGAWISAVAESEWASADCPTRLVFSTTADGASSPTEQLRITSDRYVRLASGTGGIQFGGDTAAANSLDDYEEGTWTPVIADATSAGNTGTGTFTGNYTKIGRLVHLQFTLLNLDTTGMTGANDLYIRGIPFACLTTAGTDYFGGSATLANSTVVNSPTLNILDTTSYIRIAESVVAASFDFMQVDEFTSGTADIIGAISYYTA